jgi:thioredoxin-like negative regulator of GroEL
VVSLAFVTQFQVFGENAVGYHVVSLIVHLGCVLLTYAWLHERLGGGSRAGWAALLGLVPFALHTSRPETVSWISGSTDLWMTFWSLVGVVALNQQRALVRSLGAVALALAFLSKEAAIVVPVLMVADAWLVRRRSPALGREGLAVVAMAVAILIHLAFVPFSSGGERPGLGTMPERVLATFGHFVHRTVWWLDPSVEPVLRERNAAGEWTYEAWAIALGGIFVLSLVSLAVLSHRRPKLRPYLADVLWYVLPLLPVANLFSLAGPTLVADRYLYLPMLGASALLARMVVGLTVHSPGRRWVSIAAAVLAGALGFPCAVHSSRFESDDALWGHEYERDPRSFSAINGMVTAARNAGDNDRVLEMLVRGRRAAETRHRPAMRTIFTLRIIGAYVTTTPDTEQVRLLALREALDRFVEERRLDVDLPVIAVDEAVPPRVWRALRDHPAFVGVPRAAAHARTGSLEAARDQLLSILEEYPRRAEAWNLLIAVFGRLGQWEAAREAYARAIRRIPGDGTVENMGRALARAQRAARRPAIDAIEVAVRDARVQRELGAPEAARRILDAALEQHPGEPRLVLERARADVADGRFDLARRVLERARERDPARAARWDTALRRLEEAEARR